MYQKGKGKTPCGQSGKFAGGLKWVSMGRATFLVEEFPIVEFF